MENSKSNSFINFVKGACLTIIKGTLIEAVKKGDVKTAREHINCGADVNEINSSGRAPIHYTVSLNHLSCLVLLLECKDININLKSTDGLFQETALHCAVSEGNIPAIKLLLLNGADSTTIRNQYKQTALEAIPNNQVTRSTVHETLANLAQINQAVDKAKICLEQKDYEGCINYYNQAGNLVLEKFANSETSEDAKKHYLKKALGYFEKLVEPYQKLDEERQANYRDIIPTLDKLKEQIGESKKYEHFYKKEASMSKQSQFFQVKEHKVPLTIRKRKNGYVSLEEEQSQIRQNIA